MANELELTAPIVASVVAFVMLLVHIFMQFNGSGDAITLFYDDSNSFNFSYQYVVRLLYDAKSTSFEDAATTIFVEIEHSIRRIVKIPISPTTLNQVFVYKGHRCAKIFIRTCEKYRDVRSVLLYHNCTGSILVHSVELQDIDDSNAIISAVNNPVSGGGRASNLTSYPFGIETPTEIESDIRPSRNVSISEAIYLFFASANLVYLINSHVLGGFCTNEFCGLTQAFLYGLGGGVAGYFIFFLLLLPLRFGIRTYYSKSMGRGNSKLARTSYLTLVVIIGVCGGVFSCEHSLSRRFTDINTDARILSADRVWITSTMFSLFCMLLMIGLSIPFALFFKFIELLPDEELPRGPLNGRGGKPSKAPIKKYKSAEAHTFVSSYSRVSKGSSSVGSVSSMAPQHQASTQRGTSSMDSPAGGQYYQILADQKNQVKSISQFYNEPTPTPGRNKPPQPVSPKPKTPAIHDRRMQATKDHPKRSPEPDMSRASNSVAGPESSVGDNYYAAMVNQAHIRSVSQYQKN